jgi:hypothetical protein
MKLNGTWGNTAQADFTLRFRINAATENGIVAITIPNETISNGSANWDLEIEGICITSGSSGSFKVTMIFNFSTGTNSSQRVRVEGTISPINLQNAMTLDVTGQWEAASASNIITTSMMKLTGV